MPKEIKLKEIKLDERPIGFQPVAIGKDQVSMTCGPYVVDGKDCYVQLTFAVTDDDGSFEYASPQQEKAEKILLDLMMESSFKISIMMPKEADSQ